MGDEAMTDVPDGWTVVDGKLHREFIFGDFGEAFGLSTHDYEVMHSACVGFGIERIVLGLIRSHGFESAMWPTPVRLDRMIKVSKIHQEHDYPPAAEADRGGSATCR